MTERDLDAVRSDRLTLVLYDISQLLESASDSEARVTRALGLLRSLVPYERCALLHAPPGCERELFVAPGTLPGESVGLEATLTAVLGRLVDAHGQVSAAPAAAGMHLAMPLVGLDEVVGVLFVQGPDGAYEERHVRILAMIAAKLAAYLSLLRGRSLNEGRTLQLAEAYEAAEAANRAKDEFLALVSHELRTPLNTILAWADALRSGETREADRVRAFDAIERSVKKQTKLIDDLLQLSCVAAATLRLDLRAVEPATLIKEAIRTLEPQAKQKSIRLDVALDEAVAPLIADPHRLSQVVLRLVANAIKFTPNGGRVEVCLEQVGVMARIRVVDTGSGILAEKLPTIFERFSQADGSSTRSYGGLGVGLALVKNLVELHGGQVRAESPGDQQGATFIVDLPLAGAGGAASGGERATEAADRDVRVLAGVRVLIVDDDPDIGEVLQFVLQSQGAVVALAASAAEALAAMAHSMPDVLLSDIAMPGENGHDLIRQINLRKGDAAPPAAALSGHSSRQDLDQAVASGFRTLLAKPIDPEALVAAVAKLAKSGADAVLRRPEPSRP